MRTTACALAALLLFALSLVNRAASAQSIYFTASAELTASPTEFQGRVTLTTTAGETLHDVRVSMRGQGDEVVIDRVDYWDPGSSRRFDVSLPSDHAAPGDYHLLIGLAFRDRAGSHHGIALALPYRVGAAPDSARPSLAIGEGSPAAAVILAGDQIAWRLENIDPVSARLTLTAEPAWAAPRVFSPRDSRIELRERGERPAIPSWVYHQNARLEWVDGGRHFSRIQDWSLATDEQGRWAPEEPGQGSPWWRTPWVLLYLAALVAAGGAAGAALRHRIRSSRTGPEIDETLGLLALLALTAWAIAHASPELWLTQTWSTGGDTASQVFYAKVFMDWLPRGKLTGWLPESFAGFPAFTFYFPFPFSLAALLQFAAGQQVAFKLVSMLPAFLLPAATYALAASWGWRVVARLAAALGAAGFVLAEGTSIWGGNALAQLAGEFAYSWGMLLTLGFWACLALALRRGGRWWLLAGTIEAAVAISHGYALLVAGFGAFLYLLGSNAFWRDLWVILKAHTLAFLFAGFWLVPLIVNLPWTIPNDTNTWVGAWQSIFPRALWPFGVGIPALIWALARPNDARGGLAFLLGVALLGLLGFFAGGRWGMADLRFFPFAQWALTVACAAAVGWALCRWARPVAIPLALGLALALTAWWEGGIELLPGWSRWNLSGYESKPMWPHYAATAKTNAGPLDGPRLVFEHDPANEDLGSTRTLEALPLFGSRPALEGLYMESALSGPFIYQIQAEASQRPSSPLTRYPSAPRSTAAAVGHLNEFYANRLILRSPEKQAQFGADPRFRLIAEHGPLATYELADLETKLIEVAPEPLVAESRAGWLNRAFRRFLLHHPYREREVYLAAGESLPETPSVRPEANIRIIDFSRERIVFETDAIGQPHLLRMTYHPRWQSTGGEPVFLSEPAFMILFPGTKRVELVYAWGRGDWLGAGLTIFGVAILGLGLRRRDLATGARTPGDVPMPRFLVFAGMVGALIAGHWWLDPERVYQRGHELLSRQGWVAAGATFDDARAGRIGPARQAESLFWAARSYDLGADKVKARVRYVELKSAFPESYWAPESLFRLVEIDLAGHDRDSAEAFFAETDKTPGGSGSQEYI